MLTNIMECAGSKNDYEGLTTELSSWSIINDMTTVHTKVLHTFYEILLYAAIIESFTLSSLCISIKLSSLFLSSLFVQSRLLKQYDFNVTAKKCHLGRKHFQINCLSCYWTIRRSGLWLHFNNISAGNGMILVSASLLNTQ